MSPRGFDSDYDDRQESASHLLLRVALILLGEARLRGGFGDEAKLAERAAALADELTGGAPSPDPQRAAVEVELLRPDRISLLAPFGEDSATTWGLMLDGTLFDGGTVGWTTAVQLDPQELSAKERADLERQQAEWQAERERRQQFTATRFVRAVAAPPQPGAEVRVLAVMLYEDGFYVESTYDTEPPSFDPEMDAEQFFAQHREEKPEIAIEDDLGTEYFERGGGGGGGISVSHSSFGFAPAPPPEAKVLKSALTVQLSSSTWLRSCGTTSG
jgi:hypothetical protein